MKKPKNNMDMPRSRPRTSRPMLTSQASSTRAEIATARQVDAGESPAGKCQRIALGHQEAGHENDEQHLGEFAGLDGEAGEPDPVARTVDLAEPGGQHRRNREQREAEQHRGVGEALESAVVAHDDEHRDETDDADGAPRELQRGVGTVGLRRDEIEAMDQHEPKAVQQRRARQQQRVGVRRELPDGEMRDEHERAKP